MALVVRGGTIVTPAGADVRAERGTIVVEGDRIARVAWGAEAARVEADPADRVIDAVRMLVMPGLVDAHSHFYGTLIPGLIDRLPLDVRRPFLTACTDGWTDRDTWVATLLGAFRSMCAGTTTVLENGAQGIEATVPAVRALMQSGLRAVVGPMISDRPFTETMPGYVERLPDALRQEALGGPMRSARELVDDCLAIAKAWHGAGGRISICLSPWTPYGCTDDLLTRVAEAAHAHGLPVHTHLLETRPQAVVARRMYGTTMVEHVATLGLLDARFSGAHAVWLSDREIDLMAAAGAAVSHNPLSNLYLGSGIARVPELLRRGVTVGIGSDGPNCGSTGPLFEIMKLGLGQDVGSIEVGKKADLVLVDAGTPAFVPLNDAVWQLVYGESGRAVTTVIVNGDVVLERGRPVHFDLDALFEEAAAIGQRLAERARAGLTRMARLEPYLQDAYLALLEEFGGDRAAPPGR
ncbi:MAG: hypothetical protein DMD81_27305 [Candidatus Rokuibacteriota bacterium]|nr:MAG: hypothetical protein DMD81_27305 [Candidatus Rokubacteria bacterium]